MLTKLEDHDNTNLLQPICCETPSGARRRSQVPWSGIPNGCKLSWVLGTEVQSLNGLRVKMLNEETGGHRWRQRQKEDHVKSNLLLLSTVRGRSRRSVQESMSTLQSTAAISENCVRSLDITDATFREHCRLSSTPAVSEHPLWSTILSILLTGRYYNFAGISDLASWNYPLLQFTEE
ncbi:uncharacterized protein LOC107978894 [Cricetulus griseus]|uniref:Uncharacterized protein LOC107978894 n=1 Tax=Cricetulus griseus TaxID=10029 RepID=A0A9J7GSF3_CRIGR|nr:uncharacterized protein LOC107978894 [Cricetulus griseus]XP_035304255.1 uncharacterized protein LOC107978894 [Cricetulus griseus]